MELFDVLVFCSIYSGVVIYSLWLTISDRLGTQVTSTSTTYESSYELN